MKKSDFNVSHFALGLLLAILASFSVNALDRTFLNIFADNVEAYNLIAGIFPILLMYFFLVRFENLREDLFPPKKSEEVKVEKTEKAVKAVKPKVKKLKVRDLDEEFFDTGESK